MYYIYVLYSSLLDRYYVGQTEDLERRLRFHQEGESPYTSRASDWKLMYTETFSDRTLTIKRELEIKRKKSRKYIEWLLQSASSRPLSG